MTQANQAHALVTTAAARKHVTDTAHIKASEAILKIDSLKSEIELIMRNSDPNKLQLAVIRANCADIHVALADVEYWATKKYRKDF